MTTTAEPLLVISSDGHVGPAVERYRDYFDPQHRADFDEWLGAYVPQWMATQPKDARFPETLSEDYKREWLKQEKIAAGAEGTWNPASRLASLDADGIAADVLFPDDQSANSPPFLWFAREYNRPWDKEYSPELKRAGARAYNRWLAEYCSAAPERLLGLALVGSLADVDGAIAEIRWARENGITGGVLLPLLYYNTSEPFWNDRRYDPLWATCAELDMPIHTHTGSGCPNYGDQPEAPILYALECTYWPHRPLYFLMAGGVFERFPKLKLIMTEQGSMWVRDALMVMDHVINDRKYAFGARTPLPLKPSEYFHRQCWLGASLISRPEIEQRHAIGLDKIMWGWDFPHIESADWLRPRANLRRTLQGVPVAEVRAILGGNAIEAYSPDVAKLTQVAARIGMTVGEVVSA